jgi:riboflavin synthase
MFTGLIEDVGRVSRWEARGKAGRLILKTRLPLKEMPLGCSVAVNGACLTVVSKSRESFAVDLSPETMRRTAFNEIREGAAVNLELPLKVSDRLGGHLVTGHVDGVATVVSLKKIGEFYRFVFGASKAICRLLVAKGSVTVDGISLTVNESQERRFSVVIIPFTLRHTNLHQRRVGDKVNVETDVLGKYVEKLLTPRSKTKK